MRNLLFELRVLEADFRLVARADSFFETVFFATGFDFIFFVTFALVVLRAAMLPPLRASVEHCKGLPATRKIVVVSASN